MNLSHDTFSRPDKLSHAETVLYEADMLRFTKERLLSAKGFESEADEWSYLESFLMHFRNLIEFFNGKRRFPDDLNIGKPDDIWAGHSPDPNVLSALTRPDLFKKYETRDNPDAISKYLHHCTRQRAIKKKWNVREMYEEIRPLTEQLESLLPEYKPATKPVKQTVQRKVSYEDFSTATVTVSKHEG